MSFNKKNTPFKQTMASGLLTTAMGAANAAQPNQSNGTVMSNTLNAAQTAANQAFPSQVVNTSANQSYQPTTGFMNSAFSSVAGVANQASMNQAVRNLQNPSGFTTTPRPNQTSQPQSSVVRGNPRYIRNTINNRNGMSYDNTTGPRPMAPINPRGFSNMDNVQRIFNSSYSNTPLAQVDVDPMTGQQMNPLNDQSTNSPMIPDVDSAMSPLPNPNGVQTDSLAPYYGLSN